MFGAQLCIDRFQQCRHGSKPLGSRQHMTTCVASTELLRVVEIFVGTSDRVVGVMCDHITFFVQEVIAIGTVPVEAVDFSGNAGALDDKLEGIRCETGRM